MSLRRSQRTQIQIDDILEQPLRQQQKKKIQKPKIDRKEQKLQRQVRIIKSKSQKMFLMQAQREQDQQWQFVVKGSVGKNYNVEISILKRKCTCIDFRMRKGQPLSQVAQDQELLNKLEQNPKITKQKFQELDSKLLQRLRQRKIEGQIPQQQESINLKDDTDCAICYESLLQDQLVQCKAGCQKYFHRVCMEAWIDMHDTCPLCRAQWEPNEQSDNESDALGKLKQQNIQIQD